MDFTDLVLANAPMTLLRSRFLKSPILHFLTLGFLVWGAVQADGLKRTGASKEIVPLQIPRSRLLMEQADWESVLQRRLDAQEMERVRETVIDQEILFHHALKLGLDRQPAVERRLALIAEFVADNPHEAGGHGDPATEARELGLLEQDLVVRRILIDAASRLIKGAVRTRPFQDDHLNAYLEENPEEFQAPARLSFSHVALSKATRTDSLERDSEEMLGHIRANQVDPGKAEKLGDGNSMPLKARYEGLTTHDLRRIFGRSFSEQIEDLPVGSWEGPIDSRYGAHLIFIANKSEARRLELAECRERVRTRVADLLAEEWLKLRLGQLREVFQVEIQGENGA